MAKGVEFKFGAHAPKDSPNRLSLGACAPNLNSTPEKLFLKGDVAISM